MESEWEKADLQFQAISFEEGRGPLDIRSIHLCFWEAKCLPTWKKSRQLFKMVGFQDPVLNNSQHLLSSYFVPGIALTVLTYITSCNTINHLMDDKTEAKKVILLAQSPEQVSRGVRK